MCVALHTNAAGSGGSARLDGRLPRSGVQWGRLAGRHGPLRGAEGGARLLLTEDLQHGFSWRGVRVVNPLIERQDSLLMQLLGG